MNIINIIRTNDSGLLKKAIIPPFMNVMTKHVLSILPKIVLSITGGVGNSYLSVKNPITLKTIMKTILKNERFTT